MTLLCVPHPGLPCLPAVATAQAGVRVIFKCEQSDIELLNS